MSRFETRPVPRCIAGPGWVLQQSRLAPRRLEDALVEGLGADDVQQLDDVATSADLALPWRSLVDPFRVHGTDVVVERDIAYGPAAPPPPRRLPPTEERPAGGAPVLLQVHGDGWRSAIPDHVIDVKRAIAWIRQNIADHGGDPSYVVITGGSASGHLCALAAVTPGDPAFQPGFEDADTAVQARHIPRAPHLQRRFADDPETFEAVSPLLRVTADVPDFFVLHGTADSLVDVRQSRLFVERLRTISHRTVVYAELPGAQHAFDVLPSIRSSYVVRVIDRYLPWHWNRWRREQHR